MNEGPSKNLYVPALAFSFRVKDSAEPSFDATAGPAISYSFAPPFTAIKPLLSGKPLQRPARSGSLPKQH